VLEIRIHGRGGQGNVVAAYLLAAAVVDAGLYGQAFPAFGAERRGAPVAAFVRVARDTVRRRCQIDRPHIVVVQDPTLLKSPATLAGLEEGGCVLVNSARAEAIPAPAGYGARWASLPATRIAEETVGRPMPNSALLGALLALTGLCPLAALEQALEERFPPDTAARNKRAVRAAAERVPEHAWRRVVDARGL